MSSVPIQSIGTPLFYGVFFSVVLLLIAIDMLTLKKTGAHKVSTKEALTWSVVWVLVSLLFALWLYFELAGNPAYGPAVANEKTLAFLTGYVLEKALAVDNIFVFVMIFAYFKIPPQYQHRVLLYGVLGWFLKKMTWCSSNARSMAVRCCSVKGSVKSTPSIWAPRAELSGVMVRLMVISLSARRLISVEFY